MTFIYVGYVICEVSRLVLDSNRVFITENLNLQNQITRWFRVLNTFSSRFKWIFVYYFVIIVRDLKLRLVIEDPREFGTKLRRQRVFDNSIIAIFIICQMLICAFRVLEYLIIPE